ncbi:MAG: PPC domain-containing protein, partial [Bacteroidota bacterium]
MKKNYLFYEKKRSAGKLIIFTAFLLFILFSSVVNAQPGCGDTDLGIINPSTCSPQNADYTAGTIPYWNFTANAGQTYHFSLGSSPEDTYLHLYDATYTEIASNDDAGPFNPGGASSLSWTCATGGTYYVTACHYTCNPFDDSSYLKYWSTGGEYGTGSGGTLSLTGTWQNEAYTSGNMYWYYFDASIGNTYDFSLCSNTEDSYIQIYNTNWDEQASNDDDGPFCSGAPASLSWVPLTSGTYIVATSLLWCNPFNNSSDLAYRSVVAVQPGCGDTDLGAISPSTCYPQNADYTAGTIPYWNFTANAGETYHFSLGSSSEDTYLHLYNAGYAEIASNDDAGP